MRRWHVTAAYSTAQTAPDLSGLTTLILDGRHLADLELLLSGAFAPLTGFLGEADLASVRERGRLADGTPWPIPVTLEVSGSALPHQVSRVALADPEGTPLAVLRVAERRKVPASGSGADMVRLAGPVTACRDPEHGPFRRLMLRPGQVREMLGDEPVIAHLTRGPVHSRLIGQLRHAAGELKARLLLMPLVAGPAQVVARPEALVRAVLAAAASLPPGTLVVPVPLAPRGTPPDRDLAAQAVIAAAYGATHLISDEPGASCGSEKAAGPGGSDGADQPGLALPLLRTGDWAYDRVAEVWRPLALIEPGTECSDMSPDELGDLLDAGAEIPAWFTPPAVARELIRARPPRSRRGIVLFLTGLSGSGKSTIARNLRDVLSERGDRRVSLLDGDLVRQLLSAGLTFSRADRDLNIARIGFVAAEVARHGGIAICAPIAPYAAARAQVRRMVSEVGDFLLIHVSTPVEVCAARDRKGLYAKAYSGLIDHFTGVSDPYEEPTDAELTIDTSVMTPEQATEAVLNLLTSGGWLAGEPG
jgi:sulfate adenylyltransferase